MTLKPESCSRCAFYKRGQDGRCVQCGANWPLDNENPSPEVTDAGSLTQE